MGWFGIPPLRLALWTASSCDISLISGLDRMTAFWLFAGFMVERDLLLL
jgi:hypothetical protein